MNPSQPLCFSKHFRIDENLREVPLHEKPLRARISFLMKEMQDDDDVYDRIRHLGEIGYLHRVLGELDLAELFLGKALTYVDEDELEPDLFVTYGIRLAHVWQWQQRFEESNPMFQELETICNTFPECEPLRHFVYQHAGKNLFDQGEYQGALDLFEKSMVLRIELGDDELVQSTQYAIDVTKVRLGRER